MSKTIYLPKSQEKHLKKKIQKEESNSTTTTTKGKNKNKDPLIGFLLNADKERANLDILVENILESPERGHWDLYWTDKNKPHLEEKYYEEDYSELNLRSRDPYECIQDNAIVGIDFGTTSTVVAVRENGKSRLVRIGIQDYNKAPVPEDYENPTVLLFNNIVNLAQDWNELEFRPYIKWNDVKCSHFAKGELKGAPFEILRSGFKELKTWATLEKNKSRFTLIDRNNNEKVIVEDSVNQDDSPLNPIELYAFFLGLNLNNQMKANEKNGDGQIYTNYYLTFPVKFDLGSKKRIISAFTNGLKKSLPASLGYQDTWQEKFSVEEKSNEAIAYAAAALDTVNIKPTKEGVPFGVFDFGGGTTDFSMGIFRTATQDEYEIEGWEKVIEILDCSGDQRLGGENLLNLLVCHIIEKEYEIFLKGKIQFKPAIGVEPNGKTEYIYNNSFIARSNTEKFKETIRPLWEETKTEILDAALGQISISFQNKDKEDTTITLSEISEEELINIIKEQITEGVRLFYTTYVQAFKDYNQDVKEFHILLAGNSSQSSYVKEAFETLKSDFFKDDKIKLYVHDPLLPNNDDHNAVTLKTGVALGLLLTSPGEPLGLINKYADDTPEDDKTNEPKEAPFQFSVGLFKDGMINPKITRKTEYGKWSMLGRVPRSKIVSLGYTDSPQALDGEYPREKCKDKRVIWKDEHIGKYFYACAISPKKIVVGFSDTNDCETPNVFKEYELE